MTTVKRTRRRSLYLRHALADLVRNKGANTSLLVVLILSAFLMATGAMVMERLVGSIDSLFDQAKPPHFLQMHIGDYDAEALDEFAAEQPGIEAWHVMDMVEFAGSTIAWSNTETGNSGDLSESLIDNLFIVQNDQFDYLLDQEGEVVRPEPGEVYVPVGYQQSLEVAEGDQLMIATDDGRFDLEVVGFVRDAQMASSMSSATRFLISEPDFEALAAAGGGTDEMIVEYRLSDPAEVSAFQRAYESESALPQNGQAVTHQMIRIINAFSDGLVAVVFAFISALLMVIAMVTARFMIRGKLEGEIQQIGAMRAIGLPYRSISRLYLGTYIVMAVVACLIGGVLAIPASWALTQGIQANYASAPAGLATVVAPVIALLLVCLSAILICAGVLRSIRRIDVVGALVHGSALSEKRRQRQARKAARRAHSSSLRSAQSGRIGLRLALRDLRAERGAWGIVPVVFFLATVMVVLPANLLSTFDNPRFVTYLGAPESDLRADVRLSEDTEEVHQDLLTAMQTDERLSNVQSFAQVSQQALSDQGWESLRVSVGDHAADTVEFSEGGPPEPGEIALSVLNAEKYDSSPGDTITIRADGQEQAVTVSGVYQDVTSGGYTAQMQTTPTQGDRFEAAESYVIYADTLQDADINAIAAEYEADVTEASVIPMPEYVEQTLSYITDAFRTAAVLALVLGIGVSLLTTTAFLGLRVAKDRRKLGILSALGFSARELAWQLRGKTLAVVALGVVLGAVFTATLGEFITGRLIALAGLGVTELSFIPQLWLAYGLYPCLLLVTGYVGAHLLTARFHRADKSMWLR